MNRYSRDYDRAYDRAYLAGGRFGRSRFDSPYPFARPRYDQDYGARYDARFEPRRRRYGIDRWSGDPYGFQHVYDDDYGYRRWGKSRWQTDYGDPFGDRERNTPMRIVRGEPEWGGRGRWPRRYERDYHAWGFPQHYEPYSPESGFHID